MDNNTTIPPTYERLKEEARNHLEKEIYDFATGGAGKEQTVENNRHGFKKWQIVPRVLKDVSGLELDVELFGHEYRAPLTLAPIGALSSFSENGALKAARAARSMNVPFITGMISNLRLERVAEEMGTSPFWFQLYWVNDRDVTTSIVRRVEKAGYGALVVTVDTPIQGWRPRDIANDRTSWFTWETLRTTANYFHDPAFRDQFDGPPEQNKRVMVEQFKDDFQDRFLTWEDLSFLQEQTSLPVILKGISHPDDARKAVENGADGIIVSNHGGRQIDGAISSIEALPEIITQVDGDIPVLIDGGIRGGADVFKAIALGADAVSIGRPYVFGLVIDGEEGISKVIENFVNETKTILGLTGHSTVSEVDSSALISSPVSDVRSPGNN